MTTSGSAAATAQAHPLSTRVAVEGLGSFFIVFAGLGTALFGVANSATTIGFAYGLAMVAVMISFGHISNGFFNPAFTVGMAVAGRLKYSAMALYVLAQTIGGLLASVVWLGMLQVLPAGATPETPKLFAALANGFDAHSPSQVPMIGIVIVELVSVAVLTGIVLGATSPRNKTALAPFGIGLAFALAVSMTMPLSNGSLNPARSTAVVFLAESWALQQLWLFWLAPLVGAALAALIYRAFAPAAPAVESFDAGPEVVAAASANAVAGAADGTGATETAGADDAEAAAPAAPAAPKVDDAQAFFDSPKK